MTKGEPQKLSFTVPIFEPHPPQYYIRAVSDSWLHAEAFYVVSFHNLTLPEVMHVLLHLQQQRDLSDLLIMAMGNSCFICISVSLYWTSIKNSWFCRLVLHILNFLIWSLSQSLHLAILLMKLCTNFHILIQFKHRYWRFSRPTDNVISS